ncbi:MAG: SUMF1/EgtB/PvdO family nonheme iron enzyme [Pseudolysinimonas sp.]
MTGFEFRELPGGMVELHDARRNRRRTADIASFEIAAFAVTGEQYAHVIGSTSDEQRPASSISWLDAVHFCNAASELDGLESAYEFDGEDVSWRTTAPGYRLPTEAEWEYSCRAGTSGPHYGPLSEVAWTSSDGVEAAQPVGMKVANGFGLHDTLGNVWEWCWDYLDPARYGDYRVFRGGGFADDAWNVRASVRRGGAPGMSHPDLGLRLARGGFDRRDVVQGWSPAADAERSRIVGPLPSGWTPTGLDRDSGSAER